MTQTMQEITKSKKKRGRPSEREKVEKKVLIYLKKINGNDKADKQTS